MRSALLHCLFIFCTAVEFLLSESAGMLGFKDIAFINSTLVFSFKHIFLTDTDLASMAGEINTRKYRNDQKMLHP